MELQAFVSETLRQIIEGVASTTDLARKHGAVINPSTLEFVSDGGQSDMWCEKTHRIASRVEFDVAVTASASTGADGSLKLSLASVMPFKVAFGGNRASADEKVSRIKFALQVLLPSSEELKTKTKANSK